MNPITYIIQDKKRIPINTFGSQASSFGMLAPLESSQTNIVQLFVPDIAAITNIRLALVDTGGIIFNNTIFGFDTRTFIDTNVIPESFFEGVSDKSSNSPYNIPVSNLNRLASIYVYLNVNVPINQPFIAGTIRYQWIFDYA